MEPPEKGEKIGYNVIMEDGHVVDFLHKLKRRKHLRRAVRYFLSNIGYLVGCPGGMDSYRWFGTCLNNAFSLTEEEIKAMESPLKPKGCLICGAQLINVYICFECYDRDIEAGYDPPKFENELLSVRRGKILEDAGLFPVKYENDDWEI